VNRAQGGSRAHRSQDLVGFVATAAAGGGGGQTPNQ